MDFWWQNSGVQFWWGCMFAQFLDCVCFGGNKLKCLLPLLRIFHIFKKHISFSFVSLFDANTQQHLDLVHLPLLGGIQFSFLWQSETPILYLALFPGTLEKENTSSNFCQDCWNATLQSEISYEMLSKGWSQLKYYVFCDRRCLKLPNNKLQFFHLVLTPSPVCCVIKQLYNNNHKKSQKNT